MTKQHTPGPWHVDEPIECEWPMGSVDIKDDAKAILADVIPTTSMDTLAANARLIAAAPDMIAALDEVDTAFATINIQADNLPPQQRKALQQAWRLVSAARSKALGVPDHVAEANATR